MLKTSTLEALRALIVSVHQDVVAAAAPGALRSRAYTRDRHFLESASELELLQELPVVGKAFDRALCLGQERDWTPAGDASLPPVPESRFGYLLDGVHDGEADCIRAFRQIHLLYAKFEYSHPADEAIQSFVARQRELPESLAMTPLLSRARDFVSRVLSSLDWADIIPRHGPGSLATGEKPWEKMDFKRIYLDMQELYPADQYFFMNFHHLSSIITEEGIPFEMVPTSSCKLVAVPKDFRGPRIIAMEPLEKQWIQQGQRRVLVRRLEHHTLTRGYVNFASQEVNRSLALKSSMDGHMATLDLKDASDRVSIALCSALIEEPSISYLKASRSVSVELPSKELVMLRSFSPMGSAVCFPLESLIFYALSLSAVHKTLYPAANFPLLKEWKSCLGTVYVYGDDLIVDSRFAEPVVEALSSVGLVVNKEKCCLHGSFRESCGLDAYNGQEVNPVRIKHVPDRRTPSSYPSAVSYLNEFRRRGLMNSYDTLMKGIANTFGTVPFLTNHSDPCGIYTTSFTEAVEWNNRHFAYRWNTRLHRPEWRVTEVTPRVFRCAISGWSQYMRTMVMNPYGVSNDGRKQDDDEWGIPHALTRNQRWRSV